MRRSARMKIGILTSATVLAAAIAGSTLALGPAHRSTTLGPFAWLASTTPPAGSARLTLSFGLGSVSVPPSFHAVPGDRGTSSFAEVGSDGTYLGYLNVTPQQGDEHLQGWAGFRLAHLRDEGVTSARADGAVESVRAGGSLRSCVIDDYVTKVGHHQFHEVACLVMTGRAGRDGRVVVGATPSGDPAHVWAQLERTVAAYPFA